MSAAPNRMNPFPGLRPFTPEEDYLFFGREEQTIELLRRLGSNRFVAVVGSSGSGKSSLVRCGLLSELLGGRMLGAGAAWEIAVTHPGGNPMGLLTEALLDADLYDRNVEHSRENLLATLSRSHFGLVEAVKQAGLGEGTNFLLVVDQFEEIFRFHEAGQTQQEMANEFVSLLLEATAQKEVPIYVVLTMRSDFIGECGQFEGLAEMVNRGEFLIPRLTREQYKRVIEGPIKVAGGQIAPRLLQRLLNDLGQQADQLPCLQHALMRTWDVWAEKGDADALDLDDYQRVGRMSQALSLHADEIYDSLESDRERDLCAGVFKALTVQESENRGIRRPQRLGRLCQILDVSESELLPVVDAFRRSGVTFLMPSQEVALNDRTIIDISHESLMRVWTRLRHWVDDEAQAAGIYVRLAESAELHGNNKAGLYRDPELGIALAWQKEQQPNAAWAERYRLGFDAAMSYLAESEQVSLAEQQAIEAARQRELEHAQELAEAQKQRLQQEQRAGRNLRKLVAGLAVVAVIAAIACVVALISRYESGRLVELAANEAMNARKNEQRAERSQKEAESALTQVASQKAEVESSLTKAEQAERSARAAEEMGRKLLYTTDMQLAPFVWKDDRASAEQLRTLLEKHVPESRATGTSAQAADQKPDLRGFEWHYYQHLLEDSAAVLSGHEGAVIGTAYASDGWLVTMDANGQFRRWNIGSRQEDEADRRDPPGGPGADSLAMSTDGRLAALLSGKKVRVWDTATGGIRFEVDSANDSVRKLVFSAKGDLLVVVDDKIRWYSVENGELLASAGEKFGRLQGLALSADGQMLAVIGHGTFAGHWSTYRFDAAVRSVNATVRMVASNATLSNGTLSPDGAILAVGYSLSGGVSVFDASTGQVVAHNGTAHGSSVETLAFSDDGKRLATGDAEGTIRIWSDPRKWDSKPVSLQTLKGHQRGIQSLSFSKAGNRLASGSGDNSARVWDLESAGAGITALQRVAGRSPVARYSADGRLIAVAEGSALRLWDSATGQLVRELVSNEKDPILSVAFPPGDDRILATGHGGSSHVSLWNIDSGEKLAQFPGASDLPDFNSNPDSGGISALAFTPDGKKLVAGFGSRYLLSTANSPSPLKVWDVESRQLIRRLEGHTGFCLALCSSSDGRLLASGGRDGKVIIWSTASWTPLQTLENIDRIPSLDDNHAGRMYVDDAAFSPDGAILAVASRSGSIQLWSVETGNHLAALHGHSNAVQAVAFSPDGRTLASGSSDQTVRLWNVETRRELMQLDPGSLQLGVVQSLEFSPDGRRLLVAGSGGVAFWTTVPSDEVGADQTTAWLSRLLHSKVDFQGRIQMFAESPWLARALAKLENADPRIPAARTALEADRLASQNAWSEAVAVCDQRNSVPLTELAGWLRPRGLLRVAMSFIHQQRPRDALHLLQAATTRRPRDPVMATAAGFGFMMTPDGGSIRLREVLPGSPAARGSLLVGDVLIKLNGIDVSNSSLQNAFRSLAGDLGTNARLTVRHPGQTETVDIDLVKARYFTDIGFASSVTALRSEIDRRLGEDPDNLDLNAIQAELAALDFDFHLQIAADTKAIGILAEDSTAQAGIRLQRLHRHRGDAHFALKNWSAAADDYTRAMTSETTDEELLVNHARAQTETMLGEDWELIRPTRMKSEKGAKLTLRDDASILASGTDVPGDTYTLVADVDLDRLAAIRLEALPDPTLPSLGPGRNSSGNFQVSAISVQVAAPGGDSRFKTVPLERAWADFYYKENDADVAGAIDETLNKVWHVWGQTGKPHEAVFAVSSQENATPVSGRIVVELRHRDIGQSVNLGRFRLSVSRSTLSFDRQRLVFAAVASESPWQKPLLCYRYLGNQGAIDDLIRRLPKLAGQLGDCFLEGTDAEKDWTRAIEIYSRGITQESQDVDLLSKRARAYEAQRDWQAAAADWSRAAKTAPDGARLHAEFARRAAAAGEKTLASAQFQKARDLYEKGLKADPGNGLIAASLAQLLVDQASAPEMAWTLLKPTDGKTEEGTALTVEADGAFRLTGAPDRKPHTVRWDSSERLPRAVRVETAAAETPANEAARFKDYTIAAAEDIGSRARTLRGRFVRLDLPGDSSQYPRFLPDKDLKTINLAELQVFHGSVNLALRKSVRQSTLIYGPSSVSPGTAYPLMSNYSPEYAVDGNTRGHDQGHPYAHTGLEKDPWWEVDLGNEQSIDRIVVWSRSEGDFYLRMNHFRVRVLDRSRKVVYEQLVDKPPRHSSELFPGAVFSAIASARTGNDKQWRLRLPLTSNSDGSAQYRVSVASRFEETSLENSLEQAVKARDPMVRLAAACLRGGRFDEAVNLFGDALQKAQTADVKKELVDLASQVDDVFLPLVKQAPDDLNLQMALAWRLVKRGRELLIENQPAEAEQELEKAIAIVSRLGVLYAEPKWTSLTPSRMTSKAGTTLTFQKDGSILASGINPDQDTYTIVVPATTKKIAAVRLEALPHPSLPKGGSGRDENGNFFLSNFEVTVRRPGDPTLVKIPFRDAIDSYHRIMDSGLEYPARLAIDDYLTAWDVWPRNKVRQWACFAPRTPNELPEGSSLEFELRTQAALGNQRTIGCFRISVTADEHALEAAEFRRSGADRALIAAIINAAADQKGMLERLAVKVTGDAPLQAELARHFDERGELEPATTARDRARQALEFKLKQEPDSSQIAADLAEVMLGGTTTWKVLEPIEMQSAVGATLTRLADNSILASGKTGKDESYRVTTRVGPSTIRAIRLEAIPDESLPMGSSGRRKDGDFALSGFRMEQSTSAASRAFESVPLNRAICDYFQPHSPITGVLDDNDSTYWDILPQVQQRHFGIFECAAPLSLSGESELRFVLDFKAYSELALGRFRLSVTDNPEALETEERRFAAQEIDDPWLKLALAYDLSGRSEEAIPLFAIALQQAEAFDVRKSIIEIAARSDEVFAALSRQLPNDPQLQLAWARRLYIRALEHLTRKDRAQATLDLQTSYETFVRLRTRRQEGNWTVLAPTDMRSPGGEKFTVEDDGSIFVSGPNSDHPVYIIRARTDLPTVSGLLLETIPDSRLPVGGAGRHYNGNFHVAEFSASISGGQSIPIISAAADPRWQEGHGPGNLNDHNRQTRWDTYGAETVPHWAAFEFNAPVQSAGRELTIRIDAGVVEWKNHGLGHFRLSATNRGEAFRLARIQQQVEESELLKVRVALAATIADPERPDDAILPLASAWQAADNFEARQRIVDAMSDSEDALLSLARRFPAEPQLSAARARRLLARGKLRLAKGMSSESLADLEQSLEIFRKSFSNQNLKFPAPLEMKADSGIQLELLSDGSIFAHQNRASRNDNYTLTFEVDSPAIRSMRLDVLADARLPSGGPGWNENGNFCLSEMKVHVAPANEPDKKREIPLRNAAADFSQTTGGGFDVKGIIDGIPATGWSVFPQINRPHSAVFELAEPVSAGRWRITIWLSQQFNIQNCNLGRFRISFNEAPFGPGWQAAPERGELADMNIALARAQTRQKKWEDAVASLAATLGGLATDDQISDVIAIAAPIEGALEKLSARAGADPQFLSMLVRHHTRMGNAALADAAQIKARAVLEESLEKSPYSANLALGLSGLLIPPFDARSKLQVPTSEVEPVTWRYTTTEPSADWMSDTYDDSPWTAGPGAFGDSSPAGVTVRTDWRTKDIWLRRTFDWKPDPAFQSLLVRILHDDGFELFVNGRQIYNRQGYNGSYDTHVLGHDALDAFRPGSNTLAVHCQSTDGGQLIDVGFHPLPLDADDVRQRLELNKIADPWVRLAASCEISGDEERAAQVMDRHPASAADLGDYFALRQNWDRAVVAWRKGATLRPDRLQAIFDKLTGVHRWNDAAEFGLPLALQKPEDSMTWIRIGPVLALGEDQNLYAEFCRRMAAQFTESKRPEDFERIVKVALLRPGAFDLAKLPVEGFTRPLEDGVVPDWLPAWAWGTRALLAFRAGDSKSAITYVERSESLTTHERQRAFNLTILAMAHHQLGNSEKSREAFEQAGQLIRDFPASGADQDVLIARILFNEAEAFVNEAGDR